MEAQKIVLCAFNKDSLGIRQISSYLKSKDVDVDLIFIENIDDLEISKFNDASIVGISFVTDEFLKVKLLCQKIKSYENKPLIIFGGPHPTINPKECLEYCDYVVRGEGEETMLEICNNSSGITSLKNISYLSENKLINNPLRELVTDLDIFPYPDYSDCKSLSSYNIMASRGCPFNCTYCYNNYRREMYKGKGNYLRQKSVKYLIKELQQAKQSFKRMNFVNMWDDNFLMRITEELSEFSKEYKEKINLPFYCLANPNYITEEKIKLLKKAGLTKIQIGIQTGSEKVAFEIYNRPIKNEQILKCAKICQKYSINTVFDLIFNNPFESVEDVKKTLNFVLKLPKPFKLQGYNLIFFPNTQITIDALKKGYISDFTNEQKRHMMLESDSNTPLRSFNKNSLENPLWIVNFDSKEKTRYNSLIALVPYLPNFIINFFLKNSLNLSIILWYPKFKLNLRRVLNFSKRKLTNILKR